MGTPPHKSLRILFVDDEKSLQEFMRSELPRLGHEVTVCPDGRAALKALEKATFDAAILDLRMPGMTGIEVLEQLKQVAPDTEAIVMTGHASTETAISAKAKANRYRRRMVSPISRHVQCGADVRRIQNSRRTIARTRTAFCRTGACPGRR